jgi:multidrug efflux system membrane fusion protein
MNIRFPDSFDTKSTTQSAPAGTRKGSRRTMLILGGVALLLLAVIAWRLLAPTPKPVMPPAPVLVQSVQRQDMTVVERTIGTVVANATVQVTARVQGQLMTAGFKEGDMVHKGQVLFQIDPRPYKAALDSAVATLASAKAKAERYAKLLAANAIAPQQADDARASYLEALAAVQTARLNLEYTRITSPIDGKTGAIQVQPGNMIATGMTTPLVTITQIQPVKVSFSLPQADLPRVQERLRDRTLVADVETHGTGGKLRVPVDFVSNVVDDKTGTVELRATFANTDATLVPGQLVDVGVTLNALRQVLVVPHEAVNLGPNTRFLFIVRDGVAQMVPVTVLYDDDTKAAVQGAVKAGERVITDGQLRVTPGKPVEILKSTGGHAAQ